MEFKTQIDSNKRIRYHSVKGDINIQLLMEKLEVLYKSPQFDAEMNTFWDLRQTDMSQVITEEIHLLMELVKKHWGVSGNSKSVLLVSHDLEFGLSRMYEGLMSSATSSRIKVFRDESEAGRWLSID